MELPTLFYIIPPSLVESTASSCFFEVNKWVLSECSFSFLQMLKGDHMKPLTQVWEEASALYAVNYEHAMKALERGKHTPSLNGAMNIAGPELCQIYVMNLPEGMGEPYVMSPVVRQKILQQRYA